MLFGAADPVDYLGRGDRVGTGARVPHGGYVISLERFRKLQVETGRARVAAPARCCASYKMRPRKRASFLDLIRPKIQLA